ncbi:MAG: prepilin-type N-terminal cleavage/methylation domain-containing protein [Candidatus Sumerlaeia bacterium]|nr:prepilin-type N-terminal cleavage/methylation domain-containing protein [Candidatus Sumerlaeia bacterium]
MIRNLPTRAFTLIELLIVVAIIAILAAIAVPNFLEAQTRSKVSRSAADLRTISLGLEMYRLDNNNYPYSESIGPAVWLVPGGRPIQGDGRLLGGITSPIAYISSVPTDAFNHSFTDPGTGQLLFGKGPLYYDRAGLGYVNGVFTTTKPTFIPNDAGTNGLNASGADVQVNDPSLMPTAYAIYSLGPDLDLVARDAAGNVSTASKFNINNRYDPTNGTVSTGNVIRYAGGQTYP